ncbi:MAG: sigma-70 family RNA polymerase sigma factor [Verrucomicrobia bacterium]|nr:sigma-70 family RNA polymerase sigma factor [Verrucomicrobiota bacterium]
MTSLLPDEQDALDMARLADGCDAALNHLMERHSERLFHYLVRSLQDEADAADLAQETFVKVYQHRATFDRRQKFLTWLYAIASNLVRDRFRWRARHPQVSLNAESSPGRNDLHETWPDGRPTPSELLEADERAATVRRAIAALPEELRLPLILAEYEERSQAEISQILDCSVKAVEMRLYRARQQLRFTLGKLLEPV